MAFLLWENFGPSRFSAFPEIEATWVLSFLWGHKREADHGEGEAGEEVQTPLIAGLCLSNTYRPKWGSLGGWLTSQKQWMRGRQWIAWANEHPCPSCAADAIWGHGHHRPAVSQNGGSPDFRGPSEGGGGQASVLGYQVPQRPPLIPVTPHCQQLSDGGQLRKEESKRESPFFFIFIYLLGFIRS